MQVVNAPTKGRRDLIALHDHRLIDSLMRRVKAGGSVDVLLAVTTPRLRDEGAVGRRSCLLRNLVCPDHRRLADLHEPGIIG